MVGVDINFDRLAHSIKVLSDFDVNNYQVVNANVELLPVKGLTFDKVLAIDIIEHVQNPNILCDEINRILKPNGKLLITFPAMHDKFTDLVSKITRILRLKKRKKIASNNWNPDNHNQEYSIKKWIELVEKSGFKLIDSRASTMFPPLHLYGIPRFWFKYDFIYHIDSKVCKLPGIKKFGQSLVCTFIKDGK
jgi:ubiquinone/menaquinone biosynthesis C-methylase UbiE